MRVLLLISCFLGSRYAQLVDDFVCPDEFEGYYPHLYSCDKYWKCLGGVAEIKTCGNGLAFNDQDPTFTSENCEYLYSVECGNRTEIEPPISTTNCPRLYGTFPDENDCTGFYNCRDGLANRYSCAPGLAFDAADRVCKWADQVKSCKKPAGDTEEGGEFQCPTKSRVGTFTKHAHPGDCRQYYVCISGTAREYGCPLGTVFKISDSGEDGVCADPRDVPECINYYGDLEFDSRELVKAGADPSAVGVRPNPATRRKVNSPKPRPVVGETLLEEVINAGKPSLVDIPEQVRAINRPAPQPPRLQLSKNIRPRPRVRPSNSFRARPQKTSTTTIATTTTTTTTTTIRTTTTTASTTTSQSSFISSSLSPTTPFRSFSTSSRAPFVTSTFLPSTTPAPVSFSPSASPVSVTSASPSLAPVSQPGKPAKVKAGEDYYYYYYYYDDEYPEGGDSTTSSNQ